MRGNFFQLQSNECIINAVILSRFDSLRYQFCIFCIFVYLFIIFLYVYF